jgi:ABC-2 type transport system ATP-binding protein
MILLQQVTKKFGDFTAVNALSLEVGKGEFFGFLGPNGAGKTTTIKMMTGLLTPTAGKIHIAGTDIQEKPEETKFTFGYIPDQPFLYEKLTGREFLYFIGGLFKMSKEECRTAIDELIERFEIGEWIDKRTEDYSQGMRQRISIAAALMHNPQVVIIDEPMIGLDPRSARIVKDTLKQKSHEGVTIFMSTHSLETAEELCDRVGIIKQANLIAVDTIANLKEQWKHDGKFESVFIELTK